MLEIKNFFKDLPDNKDVEIFENLIENKDLKLERIISTGQATPNGEWYDQENDEWVVLLQGSAALIFEGDDREYVMAPGDYLLIPAHQRHRVAWTNEKEPTLWLALHFNFI